MLLEFVVQGKVIRFEPNESHLYSLDDGMSRSGRKFLMDDRSYASNGSDSCR